MELGERLYCLSLKSTLKGTTIYFSQEGVDSTIVYRPSQPQAKPRFQDTEILIENTISISPMVNQKPRSNLKESVRHSGLRSAIYSHHLSIYMNLPI